MSEDTWLYSLHRIEECFCVVGGGGEGGKDERLCLWRMRFCIAVAMGAFGSVPSALVSRKYVHMWWTATRGKDCSA